MKKILSLLLSGIILISSSISLAVEYGKEYQNMPTKTYAQNFYDVDKSHWAFSFISEMYERGVINGYPNGMFYPDKNVERAEFAKIMVGAAEINVVNNYKSSFYDVSVNEWYAPYIECAKPYLTGYSNGSFNYYRPETNALREDIAVALVKLKGYDVSVADESILEMFKDVNSISKSLRKYIAVAVERGLVSGYEDNTFRGQNSITRAEATAMLWRAFQYGNDNKTASTDIKEPAKTDAEEIKSTNTDKKENDTSTDTKDQSNTTTVENNNIKDDDEEEKEKLPYIIKKLSSAQLTGTIRNKMTTDNDKFIYYIDSDNCIYKLDISNQKKNKLIDANKLNLEKIEEQEIEVTEEVTETVETGEFKEVIEEIEETVVDEETGEETTVTTEKITMVPITEEVTKEVTTTKTEKVTVAEYNDYVPIQVFYDDVNDRVLLSGYYKSIEEAFETPTKDGHYNVIYDVSDGKVQLLNEGFSFKGSRSRDSITFIATLNDSVYRIKDEQYGSYSGEYNFNIQTSYMNSINDQYTDGNFFALKYGGELYTISHQMRVYKYDFSSDYYDNVEGLSFNKYSSKKEYFYFCKKDGTMYKFSVKTGATKALNIDFSENVEFADFGSVNNIYERFFVIGDDTFVFYDETMGAFRKLSKNN